MNHTLYEIYETNADMEMGELLFQCYVRDITESKACWLFKNSIGTNKDFMIWNNSKKEIHALLLCDATLAKRGECQS